MKKDINTKREREKELVSQMIALYCKKKHGNQRDDGYNNQQNNNNQ